MFQLNLLTLYELTTRGQAVASAQEIASHQSDGSRGGADQRIGLCGGPIAPGVA